MASKLVVSFAVSCLILIGLSLAVAAVRPEKPQKEPSVTLNCSLSPDLVTEIASYSGLAQQLFDNLIKPGGSLKGLTYKNMADFSDKFGHRFTGTQTLEDSIDYLLNFLPTLNLGNVHGETVNVPVWQRGKESLYLLQPRYKKLAVLGFGSSIGTPPEGITAEVMVVRNFAELEQRAAEVPGKIVVYNEVWEGYSMTNDYRYQGANYASQYGGVAALVRSVTPFSIYSPHTGWQIYNTTQAPVKIPSAAITVEDAAMFERMLARGNTVQVKLYMEAQNLPDSTSRNVVGELAGSTLPQEVVMTSGHIDSWDVGEGSMDDLGGVYVGLYSLYALNALGFQAARTLRSVAWTAEEPVLVGSQQYVEQHMAELDNFIFVTESDEGTFTADGYSFTGHKDAACIIQEILKLAEPMNATRLIFPDMGSDTYAFNAYGVPTGAILNDNSEYFYFHHTNGDTMTVEGSDALDSCVALTALVVGVVANLTVPLPRNPKINF